MRKLLLWLSVLAAGCVSARSENQPPMVSALTCSPARGLAPFTAQCSFSAVDPDGDLVGCWLDAEADGTVDQQLSDCGTGTFAQTFSTPGKMTLAVQAIDSAGATAVASVTLIADQANRPPVISRFEVTPDTGVAPLEGTLSWSLTDADDDPLTCTLNVDGLGAPEYTLPSCTSVTLQKHVFRESGAFLAELTVTDGRGGSATSKASVEYKRPVGDLRISRAEWAQSVFNKDVKLVAGKPALARAYVLADRPNTHSVQVRATLWRAGTQVGTLPLQGPATLPLAEVPGDLAQSFRGIVPADQVQPGLEVRFVVDPEDLVAEANESNNSHALLANVGQDSTLFVTAVPVTSLDAAGNPVTARVLDMSGAMVRMWPLKALQQEERAPMTYGGKISSHTLATWETVLLNLAALRQMDASKRYYYGYLRVVDGSGITGLGNLGSPSAVGRDDSLSTVLHELGHTFGRPHAPCGGAGSPDPSFPYASGLIGSWGYDLTAQRLYEPDWFKDVMGYCSPAWVSDYNYQKVQAFLETHPPQSLVGDDQRELLVVRGFIDGDAVTLLPVYRFTGARAPQEGPLTLTVTGEKGARTARGELLEPSEGTRRAFVITLEDVGALTRLELALDGRTLFKAAEPRAAVAAGPVDLTEEPGRLRVRWSAATYPFAAVGHLGATRTTLALDLPGGEAWVTTSSLPEGGTVELSLSDGLRSARVRLAR